MNYEILFAFLIGMIILAASPGPGVFASVAKAISEGFVASLYLIGGLVVGDIIYLVLAIIGMSTIAIALGEFFFTVKIIGGIYLIYLGYKSFTTKGAIKKIDKNKTSKSKWQNFITGFLVTLGNPKPILFYASVLPTLINFEEVKFAEIFMMVFLIALVSFVVVGGYAYFASLGRKFITNTRIEKRINRASGVVMGATGTYIILK